MKRMLLSIVLILCLLAGVALPASAATLTVSEEGLAFIKEFETSFSSSKLASTVSAVNSFLSTNELELNQAQFDALVSLIYDIGTGKLNAGYRYAIAMQSECTDAEFATAWCSWVKKGGVSARVCCNVASARSSFTATVTTAAATATSSSAM